MNSSSFFPPVFKVKDSSPYHAELYSSKVHSAIETGSVTPDFVSIEVNFRGTLYKKGSILCLKNDESLEFGQLDLVLMKENKDVYFLVMPHSSSYMPEYGIHKIGEAAKDIVCINADQCLFLSTASIQSVCNESNIPEAWCFGPVATQQISVLN